MGTISPAFTYTDGQVLSPSGHNSNIYDDTSTAIMSTANGGLDSNNLNASFKINPEHVQVEAVVIGRQESSRMRIDCFSDAYGKASSQARDPESPNYQMTVASAHEGFWAPVPGCALRFWQPYDATVAQWQWSMFFHPARMKMVRQFAPLEEGGDSVTIEEAKNEGTTKDWFDLKDSCGLGLAVLIDGVLIEHTRRQTQVIKIARDNSNALRAESEDYKGFFAGAYGGRTAQWWDMTHMSAPIYAGDGSVTTPGLTQGWHDLQLVVYMEKFFNEHMSIEYTPVRNGVGIEDEDGDTFAVRTDLMARCTFGVRNARVLTLL